MSGVGIRLGEPLIEPVLGELSAFEAYLWHREAQTAQAGCADADEKRGNRLGASRQVRQPFLDEIATRAA